MARYPRLEAPITLGSATAPSRLMMTTHGPRLSEKRYLRYLEERAKGGIGLAGFNLGPLGLMQFPFGPGEAFAAYAGDMDTVAPHPLTSAGRAFYDAMIPAARAWGEAVARHGVLRVAQLYHPGAAQHSDTFQPVVAASAVADEYERHNPHALSGEEIADLTLAYGLCARRAVEAGYEGIELHCAHGYLPQQFLSPLLNRRTDAYGGDDQRRMRFLRDVIASVAQAVEGAAFIGVRLTGPEPEGGLSLSDIVKVAQALEAAGVAYISLSGGTYAGLYRGANLPYVAPAFVPQGPNVAAAAAVKAAVDIPVIVSGSITSLDQAERILADGQADIIGMVRALVAEPRLLSRHRAQTPQASPSRPCIRGNECHYGRPIVCAVNPAAGREAAMDVQPAAAARTVLIVGAGPAGIECALSASAQGHRVTLVDRAERVGGFLETLSHTSEQAHFGAYVEFARAALIAASVDVRLGVEADVALAQTLAADAVVLATGSRWSASPHAGIIDAASALRAPATVGQRVVVAGGLDDHLPPLTVADYLARQGREVILLTEAPMAGQAVEPASLYLLLKRLSLAGVEIRPLTALAAFDGGRVTVRNSLTNVESAIEAVDSVIVVDGRRGDDRLAEPFRGAGFPVQLIGDALSPRRMLHATLDGARAGLSL